MRGKRLKIRELRRRGKVGRGGVGRGDEYDQSTFYNILKNKIFKVKELYNGILLSHVNDW